MTRPRGHGLHGGGRRGHRRAAAQYAALGEQEAALKDTIEAFRQEEPEHRDIGLQHGAEEVSGYPVLSAAIKGASRLAIWLSERC